MSTILQGLGVGVVTLIVVWLGTFIRKRLLASYERDCEQQEELADLRQKLNPEFPRLELWKKGPPTPVRVGSRLFLVFKLTLINNEERMVSVELKLRIRFTRSLWASLEPESSPMRIWEEAREREPGGLALPLDTPLNLGPGSAGGYLAFEVDPVLAQVVSNLGIAEYAFRAVDLSTRKEKVFRTTEAAPWSLGFAPGPQGYMPPGGPPTPTTAGE